jgi:hypothetical protein
MKEKTIKSLVEYGEVLRKIHNRLVAEAFLRNEVKRIDT